MSLSSDLVQAFGQRFGAGGRLFRAPGRINIIGEHTDYSEGFVMPAAIDRACLCAAAPSPDGVSRIFSLNRGGDVCELDPARGPQNDWSDYAAGVFSALQTAGVSPVACHIGLSSNVPEGAGVSSSAALEVSVLTAVLALSGIDAPRQQRAAWARSAEADFVGVPCGIMDQFISVSGLAGCALVLDCRTLEARIAPIPEHAAFAVIDSGVRHQLTDGGYAQRRAECEDAARLLNVRVLRDADLISLAEGKLSDTLHRRARHVITESQRVALTATALSQGDLSEVGCLMNASHHSLQNDFAVTCPETDQLADLARRTPGVYGARQMGGGFGGAVLALCDRERAETAVESILEDQERLAGRRTEGFVCTVGAGAGEIMP
ncbi:MAG: galactokinase [Alphaproteobacteria bacterium]|nr:galactokinase [Alphaproteobacteria bacterium]